MKLLIIDDEPEMANFLKDYLKQNGFSPEVALSGQEGLRLIKKTNYQLVILDLLLPDLAGEAICQKIRNNGNHCPILVVSGNLEKSKKVELLNLGADDYLEKPFSAEELLARVKALIRRPATIKESLLKIQDLEVDREKKIVKVAGQEKPLTKKEYLILEYLINNAKRLVTREELMDRVWNLEVDYFSKTIETHIMNLRKKINSDNKNPLIKTVFGRGYKFN